MDDAEHWSISIEKKLKVYSIIQTTSATVSVLASVTLIVMICRSHKKLSTTLHRLLLGLSISDVVASLAMSFSSTLSPPDQIGWNRSANMSLCRAQGFIGFFAHNASPLYNCSLCVYYLTEIKYTQLKENMNKIEIFLHSIPVLIPLFESFYVLAIDEFKPGATMCYPSAFQPFECRYNPEVECDEGFQNDKIVSYLWACRSFILVPLIISVSMTVIFREVASQERSINVHRYSFSSRGSNSAQRNTIAARNRAAAYSSSWLLSWSAIFVIVVMQLLLGIDKAMPFPLNVANHLLYPLQGLFNFIVYLYPKVIRELSRLEREGVARPRRFLLALRDSLLSRGRPVLPSGRNRSYSRRIVRRNVGITEERREETNNDIEINEQIRFEDNL